jgi:protein SFI1
MDLTSSIEGILDATVSTSAQTVLASLTSEDVKVIDAIIGRASSATTFLTVFKAYNEVLQELNLNSEEDIVYYKFLLKLGVIKGATWGDKWRSAKAQHGYKETNSDNSAPSTPHAFPRPRVARPIHRTFVQDDAPQKSMLLSRRRKPLPNLSAPSTSSISLTPSNDISRSLERLTLARQVEGKITSSLAPPSVPSTSSTLVPIVSLRPRAKRDGLDLSSQSKGLVHLTKRPHRNDHNNLGEEDAWEKLRQAKYERLADDFRANTLLIKCLDVWRRGAEWILVGKLLQSTPPL